MDGMLWTVAGLGFLLGLRHALDPDHLVAVSTIVSERPGLARSSVVGALWGLGHALSLIGFGGAIVALKLKVPPGTARLLEIGVALMLVGLGLAAIRGALRYRLHLHTHAHDGRQHVHVHAHRPGEVQAHDHRHLLTGGLKPFAVGLVHGLAGSAGLALLALGLAPSLAAGLAYVGMLGLGALFGMLALTTLMSLPLAVLDARYAAFHHHLRLAAGGLTVVFGLWLLAWHVAGPWVGR